MEKLLPVLLSASLLIACGGSGGGSSPQPSTPTPAPAPTPAPVPAPNEAPTISGTFTLNAKAAQSNKIVLNTADKENDQLNFSIANKPDWISFNLTDNQLELDFQPGFFDIDDYQLKFRISDGKDATEYDFNLVVEDNREQWQEIDMTEAETVGIWSNQEENTKFIFLSNKTGIYAKDDKMQSLSWSALDTVDMGVYDLGCFETGCSQQNFFELSVVAQEQNRIRVSIFDRDDRQTVLNLTKEKSLEKTSNYYSQLTEKGLHFASFFDDTANTITAELNLKTLFLGTQPSNNYGFSIVTEVAFDNGYYRATTPNPILLRGNVRANFYNNVTRREELLSFNAFASNFTVAISESGLLTTSADIHFELVSDLAPYTISDYDNLSEKTATQKASSVLQSAAKPTAPIQLLTGKSYSGRLIGDDQKVGDTEYLYGGTIFKILDDTQGEVTLNLVGIEQHETHNFTWQLNDNILSVVLNGIESNHEIVSLPNDTLGITSPFTRDDGSKGVNIYGFNQVTEQPFTRQEYVGRYKHSLFDHFDDGHIFMTLNEDNKGRYSGTLDSNLSELWEYQDDGSISIINAFGCDNITDYEQCLQTKLNDSSLTTTVRNLKLLAISGNIYKFQYSLFTQSTSGIQRAFQSIRYFEKLAQ